MWRGWNSQFIKDPLPIQEISYLPNINAPITRLDVVNKTLAIAEQVRKECGEDYMRTGYDSQAAKLAYRIQDRETELYKRLFIDIGAMHFLMAFFGGVGYIITGSGLLEVLVESEVLGSGSVKGFTKGTYYSRCERLHPCLYMSCSNLHIKEFLKEQYPNGDLPKELLDLFEQFSDSPSEIVEGVTNPDIVRLLKGYESYSEKTKTGKHGKTAQFSMIYMQCIEMYLHLERSVRTNGVELYTHSLGEMVPVMWATNRPNYKRWGTKSYLRFVFDRGM